MRLTDLPKDVLVAVFRQGDRIFLSAVVAVCKRFHSVIRSDHVLSQRMAPLVFKETGQRLASARQGQLFVLAIPPVSRWFSGRFETHVEFRSENESNGLVMSAHNALVLFSTVETDIWKTDFGHDHSLYDFSYLANGEVWHFSQRANYPRGSGDGERGCKFELGKSVGVCIDLDVGKFANTKRTMSEWLMSGRYPKCIKQVENPNCVVQFSRNGKVVRAPFFMRFDLESLRIGVVLVDSMEAKTLNSVSDFRHK